MRHLIRYTFLFLIIFTAFLAAAPKWSLPPLDVSTAATQPDDPEYVGEAQVGVDAGGNSYSVWVVNLGVYGSTLPFGGKHWSAAPQLIGGGAGIVATFPSLAVNSSGQAMVVWSNGPVGGPYQVYYSAYNPVTGLWGATPAAVDPTGPVSDNPTFPQVSINDLGQAVAVWDVFDNSVTPPTSVAHAAYFNGTAWELQQAISGPSYEATMGPTSTNYPFQTLPQVGIDAAGNAVAVWQRQLSDTVVVGNTVVESAVFSSNTGLWSTPTLLAVGDLAPYDNLSPANVFGMTPQISVNKRGEAVAVWDLYNAGSSFHIPEAKSYDGTWSPKKTNLWGNVTSNNPTTPSIALNAAGKAAAVWIGNNAVLGSRRNAKGKWTNSVQITNGSSSYPQVAIDAVGQAVASWEIFGSVNYTGVEASFSHHSKNRWSNPKILISETSTTALPRIATNAFGDTTVVWTNLDPVTPTTPTITTTPTSPTFQPNLFPPPPIAFVQSSTIILAPEPARHFRGVVTTNTFPMQTECIHTITWEASLDPNVVGYSLYSGKKLIATFPSKGPFKVTIRDACCGESTTYTLVTMSAGSKTSQRIILY
jgi:hypothetical protein